MAFSISNTLILNMFCSEYRPLSTKDDGKDTYFGAPFKISCGGEEKSIKARRIYDPKGITASLGLLANNKMEADDLDVGPGTPYPLATTVKIPIETMQVIVCNDQRFLKWMEFQHPTVKIRYNLPNLLVFIFGQGKNLEAVKQRVLCQAVGDWRDLRLAQPTYRTCILNEEFDGGFRYLKLNSRYNKNLEHAYILAADGIEERRYQGSCNSYEGRCASEGYALDVQRDGLLHDIQRKILCFRVEQGPNHIYNVQVDIGKAYFIHEENELPGESSMIEGLNFSTQLPCLFLRGLARRLELNGFKDDHDPTRQIHVSRQPSNSFETTSYVFDTEPSANDEDILHLKLNTAYKREHLHYVVHRLNGMNKMDYRLRITSKERLDKDTVQNDGELFAQNYFYDAEAQVIKGDHLLTCGDYLHETYCYTETYVNGRIAVHLTEIGGNNGRSYVEATIKHLSLTAFFHGKVFYEMAQVPEMVTELMNFADRMCELVELTRAALPVIKNRVKSLPGVKLLRKDPQPARPLPKPPMKRSAPLSSEHPPSFDEDPMDIDTQQEISAGLFGTPIASPGSKASKFLAMINRVTPKVCKHFSLGAQVIKSKLFEAESNKENQDPETESVPHLENWEDHDSDADSNFDKDLINIWFEEPRPPFVSVLELKNYQDNAVTRHSQPKDPYGYRLSDGLKQVLDRQSGPSALRADRIGNHEFNVETLFSNESLGLCLNYKYQFPSGMHDAVADWSREGLPILTGADIEKVQTAAAAVHLYGDMRDAIDEILEDSRNIRGAGEPFKKKPRRSTSMDFSDLR